MVQVYMEHIFELETTNSERYFVSDREFFFRYRSACLQISILISADVGKRTKALLPMFIVREPKHWGAKCTIGDQY